jgi:TolB-like protein/tetratricopeptide (TPR) repeat protein
VAKAKTAAATVQNSPVQNASAETPGQKSVAVLPFVNMSGDKDNEYLSDGITEDVLNGLAKVPGLRVPARTSAFAFKGKNEDIRKIGELLNVSAVLEGSVQRSGDKLRITAQLINVADGYHLWSEQFNRDMKDVFAIQDEITDAIVSKLKVTLAGGQTEVPHPKHGTENIEAYQLYLKGRFHAGQYTRDSLQLAVNEFEQAVEKQPDYARAYAELAYNYGVMVFFGYASPEEVMPKMAAASEKASELDDSLAEIYILKGSFRLFTKWDWAGAEEAFRHAVELEPENPDTHRSYADYFNAMGRFQEARDQILIAEKLDPLSESLKSREGWIYFRSGQYDSELEVARKMIAANPNNYTAHELLGAGLFRKGKRDEGIAETEIAVRLDGSPMTLAALGRMYGAAGEKSDAQKVLQQLLEISKQAHIPSYCVAHVYEGLGDFDKADEWMEKAIEVHEGPLVYLKSDADEVNRANPHFPEWLKKIGLN